MIYFVLPDFIEKNRVNNFLIDLSRNNLNYFKGPIYFTQISGCFPYSIWNGSLNSNYSKGFGYLDLYNFQSKYPIRLDCSNLLIEDNDFFNVFQNLILKRFENSSFQIEISNLKLLNYIKEKYPNYRYIFSEKADLLNRFDINLINSFLDFQEFDFIKLPIRFNKDQELLKNIKNPSKIEIIINPLCYDSCIKKDACVIAENNAQINYSELSCYKYCCNIIPKPELLKNILHFEDLMNLEKEYKINHFSFQNMPQFKNDIDLLNFYIKYFIKEEYQMLVFEEWINGGKYD